MGTMENTNTAPRSQATAIQWKRVVLGALLSEVGIIAVLSSTIAIYGFAIAPGLTEAQFQESAERVVYYLAAPAAALATFVFAFWAVRKIESHLIINGALVGVLATALSLGFLFAAEPKNRFIYMISFAARIAAGGAAGFVAQHGKGDTP